MQVGFASQESNYTWIDRDPSMVASQKTDEDPCVVASPLRASLLSAKNLTPTNMMGNEATAPRRPGGAASPSTPQALLGSIASAPRGHGANTAAQEPGPPMKKSRSGTSGAMRKRLAAEQPNILKKRPAAKRL